MLFPACTGFGDATFVTDKFGPLVPTMVVAVAVLFDELGSLAAEATETVSVMAVPFATPLLTLTTIENVPELSASMLTFVQVAVPVPPTAGVRQVHPEGGVKEMNVVLAGMDSTTVALSAALGPPFVTTCV